MGNGNVMYVSKKEADERRRRALLEQTVKTIESNHLTAYDPQNTDMTKFNEACRIFRGICGEIGELLGIQNFLGGYDDLLNVKDDERLSTKEGQHLINMINLANSQCLHEARKIGLSSPDWFYMCWGIKKNNDVEEGLAPAEEEQPVNDEPNPPAEQPAPAEDEQVPAEPKETVEDSEAEEPAPAEEVEGN